ncbi:MAG TPA: sugar phosphate isomerase/epimerase [Flavihumibacter sp.]|nr:sugar phosphate isomerase/epimerase [Flavihumibacter sp.]
MSSRRDFIRQASLIAPAAFLLPDQLFAAKKQTGVGLQLYTLRDLVAKDPKGTLEKVAAAGYKFVELYGYNPKDANFFGMPLLDYASFFNSLGLKSPSGHYMPVQWLAGEGDTGREELENLVRAAVAMKNEYFTIPYLMDNLRPNLDGYKRLAGRINAAAELVRKAGLKMCYHNHDFEFKSYEGITGYDILTKECDPKLVSFELDLYWVVRAGKDPIQLIESLKGRVPMWHVKDMSKADPAQQTEVGNGSIDFKRIFSAAKTSGLKYFFVEQENNYVPDPIGAINSSIQYIKASLL